MTDVLIYDPLFELTSKFWSSSGSRSTYRRSSLQNAPSTSTRSRSSQPHAWVCQQSVQRRLYRQERAKNVAILHRRLRSRGSYPTNQRRNPNPREKTIGTGPASARRDSAWSEAEDGFSQQEKQLRRLEPRSSPLPAGIHGRKAQAR